MTQTGENGGAQPALEEAWQDVLARWDDDDAHDRTLRLAQTLRSLGEIGRRYREIRDTDVARRERALRSIERIVALSMVELGPITPFDKGKARRVILAIAAIVSLSLVGTVAWLAFMR